MKHNSLKPFIDAFKMLLFWILVFDFHRLLFSMHHWGKLKDTSIGEWLLSFVFSFRLDLGTAAALSAIPFLFRFGSYFTQPRIGNRVFRWILVFFIVVLVAVQAGEIVAYGEWNHKLTSRVFMHLSHPDEVARTANYGMIGWFACYFILELLFALWLSKKLVPGLTQRFTIQHWSSYLLLPVIYVFIAGLQFLSLRGGWQQIPLNISAAIYSDKAIANDISINSLYFFGKSYLLYNRSTIDEFIPKVNKLQAQKEVAKWYSYPKKHDRYFVQNTRPNVVIVVLEGWSAEALGSLGPNKGASPHFDALTKSGVLFTNIYATSTTSEIGNSSIFSGNPAVPEVSISMQPEKHRKLHCLNEDFEAWGYHSSYIFSGDLKYGNIGGYFMDHGFDVVKDESDFPSSLPRGKLNFFDKDLYRFLIREINTHKQPFLQCAFTGSTHAPYDQPKGKGKVWKGEEADFMNALVYADNCLGAFIQQCKKYPWYKNTLFVFVADHGHASPTTTNPGLGKFYHIPLLFFGEPIKPEYRGKRMDVIGSQSDIAATLLTQLHGDCSRYPWSKDLMNPAVPQFAFHSIIRGFGWVTPEGNFTYNMEQKVKGDDTYTPVLFQQEMKHCSWFLSAIYEDYKAL
jgi:phosphoglycerol transferase MdoB-like AlkP superfamily enzyme